MLLAMFEARERLPTPDAIDDSRLEATREFRVEALEAADESVDWIFEPPTRERTDRMLWPPWPGTRLEATDESNVEPKFELEWPTFEWPTFERPRTDPGAFELMFEPSFEFATRDPAALSREIARSSPGPARISDVCDW